MPGANNAQDLGSGSLRWRNLYTQDLNLSNETPDISDSSENADKIVESIIEEFDGEILR